MSGDVVTLKAATVLDLERLLTEWLKDVSDYRVNLLTDLLRLAAPDNTRARRGANQLPKTVCR
jgi:hypothetical protein